MPARHARTAWFPSMHGIIFKWARHAKNGMASSQASRHHLPVYLKNRIPHICCPVAASHDATGILHILRQVFLCLCKSRNDMRENEILSYFLVQAHFLERGANMRVHA